MRQDATSSEGLALTRINRVGSVGWHALELEDMETPPMNDKIVLTEAQEDAPLRQACFRRSKRLRKPSLA